MASACWEPFLFRGFPEDLGFSAMAESSDWERLALGRGLEFGAVLQRG